MTRPSRRRTRHLALPITAAFGVAAVVFLHYDLKNLTHRSSSALVTTAHAEQAKRAPAPPAISEPSSVDAGHAVADLKQRHLLIPVQGADARALRDTFADARQGGRRHEALDIPAPRLTPVLAVEDGTIEKLFMSVRGGLTIYEFEPSLTYAYYYAHLDGYAPGLKEHVQVHQGDVIGFVGTTGNAPKDAPHLHFSIFVLTSAHQWWRGTAVNPYKVWRS